MYCSKQYICVKVKLLSKKINPAAVTVATDALVLMYQATPAKSMLIKHSLYWSNFVPKYYINCKKYEKIKLHFDKKNNQLFKCLNIFY